MTKDEVEKQKSLALAELAGWRITIDRTLPDKLKTMINTGGPEWFQLCLYSESHCGLAQFAAILLTFPEVMELFKCVNEMTGEFSIAPNQANILDEILRMYGLWQEEWSRYGK